MSWHMTQMEKDQIDQTWRAMSTAVAASVNTFLNPAVPEAGCPVQ